MSRCSEGGGSSHSADISPTSSKMGGGSPRKGVHRVPLLRELFMQVGDTRDAREASVYRYIGLVFTSHFTHSLVDGCLLGYDKNKGLTRTKVY